MSTTTLLFAALTRAAARECEWSAAAHGARRVLAAIRRSPITEHEFTQDDIATLQAVAHQSAQATREAIETMVTDGAPAEEIAEHRAMLESLDRCAELLNRTTTLHAVLGQEVARES